MTFDLSIIIPCYNEAGNLAKVKRDLMPVVDTLGRTWSVEVIFVDDGSTDSTGKLFEMAFRGWLFTSARMPIRISVLQHKRSRGLGAALRTGFRASRGDVILTTDCAGAYSFGSILGLYGRLKPGADIVTASPYHPDGRILGVPGWRLVLGKCTSLMYRTFVSRQVYTYTSLFRVYRRWVIDEFHFHSDGSLAGTELLVKAILDGVCVEEYPTTLNCQRDDVSWGRATQISASHLVFLGRVLLHKFHIRPFTGVASPTSDHARTP